MESVVDCQRIELRSIGYKPIASSFELTVLWRRNRDSNPKYISAQMFSGHPEYPVISFLHENMVQSLRNNHIDFFFIFAFMHMLGHLGGIEMKAKIRI